jgi:hypothetical protein
MKKLLILILLIPSCTCPPKLADGTKPPCRYVGPSIQGSVGFSGVSVGLTLYGEPSLPTIVIPINKHDPEPVYPTK